MCFHFLLLLLLLLYDRLLLSSRGQEQEPETVRRHLFDYFRDLWLLHHASFHINAVLEENQSVKI